VFKEARAVSSRFAPGLPSSIAMPTFQTMTMKAYSRVFLSLVLSSGLGACDSGGSGGPGSGSGSASANGCSAPEGGGAVSDQVSYVSNVTVTTLAGGAAAGSTDGPIAAAGFANPVSVVVEPSLIVADFDNDTLRRIDVATGTVSTLTQQADFQRPYGLALGANGALYVDTDYDPAGDKNVESGTIWRVDTQTGAATVVAADIGRPRGVAVMHDGRLVLGDYQNTRVLLLDPTAGTVTTLVGDTCADGQEERSFAVPYGVVVLPDGRAVVADQNAHRLSAVGANGSVTVFSGSGSVGTVDGGGTSAAFSQPKALAVDGAGNIYVSDTGSHRIRRVAPDGTVTTVAGSGQAGASDGGGAQASFWGQEGIAVTSDGRTVYVADGTGGEEGTPYNRIRKITIAP
jgi:sugar lactone lactonase YvrE